MNKFDACPLRAYSLVEKQISSYSCCNFYESVLSAMEADEVLLPRTWGVRKVLET